MGDQIGRILFSLGSFLKVTEVAQIFGLPFPQYQLCINFDKNDWLGYTLGGFFHKLTWPP
jgi:hypothetical protein